MSQDSIAVGTHAGASSSSARRGLWSSRWAFFLAATGSAVGLGNIWKFPYMTGVYGGGAFVVMYLFCIALVGVPIMLAETLIGRRGRQSPVNAMKSLAIEAGASKHWSLAALMGMVAALLILSFYSVVAGWSLDYIIDMGRGDFTGISADGAGAAFGGLTSDPWRLTLWHSLFMLITAVVIAKGVVAGLERSRVSCMHGERQESTREARQRRPGAAEWGSAIRAAPALSKQKKNGERGHACAH